MARHRPVSPVSLRVLVALCIGLLPVVAGLLPVAQSGTQPVVAADEAAFVPGELLVRFREDISEEERKAALMDAGAVERQTFYQIDAKLVETKPENLPYVLDELSLDPRVLYAEPNYLLKLDQADEPETVQPNDPEMHFQWALNNTGQWANGEQGVPGADIDAPEAWAVTTGSSDVIVAVIDSGVEFSHPDLGGNTFGGEVMWVNRGEMCPGCSTDGLDNDANGYIDDWRGWDFFNEDGLPHDDNGHGTHVAGVIGARGNNGIGVTGIAWDVRLMGLKTFNAGGAGPTDLTVAAVLYAADNGADIINASWGQFTPSSALEDAITYAGQQGVLFVAASGNDGVNTDLFGHYPSALDIPSIVSVAATNNRDELAWFSNYGLQTVDIGAPGQDIYATWQTGELGTPYQYVSGTSMAAPHVVGAAALIKSQFPDASPIGIKNLLFNSVDPLPSLEGRVGTGGRLNLQTVVSCQDEPQVWIDRPVPGFAAVPGDPVEVRLFATNCAVPDDAVTVTARSGEQEIALTAVGGGMFQGTFSPAAPGPISVIAEATLGDLTDRHEVTGEAVLNYRFQNDTFEWLDATGGTQIPFPDERDFQAPVELPFEFTYYDRTFSEALVSENGMIAFGDTNVTSPHNVHIPDVISPNGYIAALWDNLDIEDHGEIWYATAGEAPNRKFVVSWVDVEHADQRSPTTINPPPPDGVTFQIILEESTNEIVLQYLDASFGRTSLDYGNSATIGLEHFSGTIGVEFSYQDPVLRDFENVWALRFLPSASDTPEITTLAPANAPAGMPYVQPLGVEGGTPPYSWAVVDGALPPGVGLDPATGIIAGTPYETGRYEFTVAVTDSADPARTASQLLGFAVVTGYTVSEESFAWVDPAGGEILPVEDDDQAFDLEMPFGFTFYGQEYAGLQVSSNGYFLFSEDRGSVFTNTELPEPRTPNAVVAGYWDDLSADEVGQIIVSVTGEEPSRRFVVSWVGVERFATDETGTFQIILEEGSNDIVYQYEDLDFGNERYNFGESATVGIENQDGTVGVQYAYEDTVLQEIVGTTALRFSANPPPEPVMNVETLKVGELHAPYHDLLSARGGAPPFTWSVAGGTIPPGLSLDPASGVISGVPTVVGAFTFTAEAVDSGDPASAEYTIEILPSYQIEEIPFAWHDPAAGATQIALDDDDAAVATPLPFPFVYYGQEYAEVWVSTNGALVFGDGERAGALSNRAIPDPDPPNGIAAVFWDDLSPQLGGGLWVQTIGAAPNRQFFVTWVDAPRFNQIGAATFQAVLEEGSNVITYHYLDLEFGDERYDWGAAATIGVESPDGSVGTQYSFNEPVGIDLVGQTSLRFVPVVE